MFLVPLTDCPFVQLTQTVCTIYSYGCMSKSVPAHTLSWLLEIPSGYGAYRIHDASLENISLSLSLPFSF